MSADGIIIPTTESLPLPAEQTLLIQISSNGLKRAPRNNIINYLEVL